jgi:hypothetical protein
MRRGGCHHKWGRGGFFGQSAADRAKLNFFAGVKDDVRQLFYRRRISLGTRCNAMRSAERGPIPGSLAKAEISAMMELGRIDMD